MGSFFKKADGLTGLAGRAKIPNLQIICNSIYTLYKNKKNSNMWFWGKKMSFLNFNQYQKRDFSKKLMQGTLFWI